MRAQDAAQDVGLGGVEGPAPLLGLPLGPAAEAEKPRREKDHGQVETEKEAAQRGGGEPGRRHRPRRDH